jgi:SAM-dependent methyltransferase
VPLLKRLSNILKYGVGPAAREKKRADKAAKRETVFASPVWQRDQELAQRKYASYEDYVTHQAAKLDKIEHRLRETEAEDFAEFKRRFQGCPALSEARVVLCLGARLGTEVRALHALGYFAVGIDLNPGADNYYVLPGDFHHLVFPDNSVDAIYTNVMDHVFDLDRMLAEVNRLLRPNGLFLVDLMAGFGEGSSPGAFEAIHWRDTASFVRKLCEQGPFVVEAERDLGQIRRDRWQQVLLRKPVPVATATPG